MDDVSFALPKAGVSTLPIVTIVHSYVYWHTLTYRLTCDEEYEWIRNCSKALLSDRPSASRVATSTEVKVQLSKVTFHSLLCFRYTAKFFKSGPVPAKRKVKDI